MRDPAAIATLLVLVGCQTVPGEPDSSGSPARNQLASEWSVTEGWPGDYPPGFSVGQRQVAVPGRGVMNPDVPTNLSCILPSRATYQPWNKTRIDSDGLLFRTAARGMDLLIVAPASITALEADASEEPVDLELSPGDRVVLKSYAEDGSVVISRDGLEQTIPLDQLQAISDMPDIRTVSPATINLWINIPCSGLVNRRAWVLYSDAIAVPGVFETPLSERGLSEDLTEKQAKQLGNRS